MLQLREHQIDADKQVIANHDRNKNIMVVLPTGAGKTILMAYWAWQCAQRGEGCVIFAHRDVLLEQISAALCRFNLYHSLYCSKSTIQFITNNNLRDFGNSYYKENSLIIIASVDMFYRKDVSAILPYIKLWMIDEGHHVTKDSKWHKCVMQMDDAPHIKGLLVTATPLRADRKGLGRNASGIVDKLIVGATMSTLIERELLCPYKIYVPVSMIDVSKVNITNSGDYNRDKLAKETDKSHITGSVIDNWKQYALGKRTIVFTVNIEHSIHVAAQFRANGINAVSLSSEDLQSVRKAEIDNFRAGRTTVLVNCDLFSEGFDVPAVEVIIMLCKTLSYAKFKQQFGRMLRILDGKMYGILIDHVGNVPYFMDHYDLKYPHDDPEWTLEDAPKKPKRSNSSKTYETITCKKCRAFYVIEFKKDADECPHCGHKHSDDEKIDAAKLYQEKRGQLAELELNLDLFTKLIEERKKVDETPETVRNRMKYAGAPAVAYNSAFNNHAKRRNAQSVLRSYIQEWCVRKHKATQFPLPLVQREFELSFGLPILKAHILSEPETIKLTERIQQGFINE